MYWALFILIGAPINALVNLGYKTHAGSSVFLFGGAVSLVTAICMIGYGLRGEKMGVLLAGGTPYVIAGMGIGTALSIYLFISAVTKGPLTLTDPLWACLYSLVSAGIGLWMLRETPSAPALTGVGLYLVGAFLMARG